MHNLYDIFVWIMNIAAIAATSTPFWYALPFKGKQIQLSVFGFWFNDFIYFYLCRFCLMAMCRETACFQEQGVETITTESQANNRS